MKSSTEGFSFKDTILKSAKLTGDSVRHANRHWRCTHDYHWNNGLPKLILKGFMVLKSSYFKNKASRPKQTWSSTHTNWRKLKASLPDDCRANQGTMWTILIPLHSKWIDCSGIFFLIILSLSMEYLGANTYLLILPL